MRWAFVCLSVLYAQRCAAQDAGLIDFAGDILFELQQRSFDRNREFCGTIGIDADGALIASTPRRGRRASCTPLDPDGAVEVVASYHTHGAWSPRYESEIPSTDDVWSDMVEQLFGFVSTPGGRFWVIDWRDGSSRQVCQAGCMPIDPDMPNGADGDVAPYYLLHEIEEIFGN